MFHFYDTVRIYGDIEFGNSGNISLQETKESLDYSIRTGVCNLSNFNNGTKGSPVMIPISGKSGESYVVSWRSITSTSSANSSRMAFMNGQTTVSDIYYASHGTSGSHTFTLTADCDSLWVYAGSSYEANKSVTASNLMLRPDYLPDTGYSNYTMTNEELTAAIQAIQAQLN